MYRDQQEKFAFDQVIGKTAFKKLSDRASECHMSMVWVGKWLEEYWDQNCLIASRLQILDRLRRVKWPITLKQFTPVPNYKHAWRERERERERHCESRLSCPRTQWQPRLPTSRPRESLSGRTAERAKRSVRRVLNQQDKGLFWKSIKPRAAVRDQLNSPAHQPFGLTFKITSAC